MRKRSLLEFLFLLFFLMPAMCFAVDQPLTTPRAPAAKDKTDKSENTEKPLAGKTWQEPTTGMQFVELPGGCFKMGSPDKEKGRRGDEGPVHEACVDEFSLGKYEVTQGQWQKVMGNNPSGFQKGKKYPVEQVSWDDIQEFIKKLNEKNKEYRFRLPTEAEWEYAARAGTNSPYNTGEKINSSQANFSRTLTNNQGENITLGNDTVQVGSYKPNGFGLYDMHGNVAEWCNDWYQQDYYKHSSRGNPKGPEKGIKRVIRGGSIYDDTDSLRSASRDYHQPHKKDDSYGFRLAADKTK